MRDSSAPLRGLRMTLMGWLAPVGGRRRGNPLQSPFEKGTGEGKGRVWLYTRARAGYGLAAVESLEE